MWTCRKCSAEVEDNFEICWSCGTSVDGAQDPNFRSFATDDEVPAPAVAVQAAAATKLVSIATYWIAGQAHEVQCLIEADGIPVTVAYEFGIATDWFLDNATGSIQLQVAEADVEKARKVLADHPKEAPPLPPAPPKPAAPDEADQYKAQPWLAPIPKDLSREETLKYLEAQVSALMDSKDVPGWKVNPAFHPDVMAFIQKHANNVGFVQKAQQLQRNRAKYFATIRTQELAPKPVVEEAVEAKEAAPAGPPVSERLTKALRYGLVTLPVKVLRRVVKWTMVLGIATVVIGVMAAFVYRGYGQNKLEEAMREVSEKDKYWTWEDIQATRKEIADKDNAALVVLAIAPKLAEENPGVAVVLRNLVEKDEHPNRVLQAKQPALLTWDAAKTDGAIEQARCLASLLGGRWPEAPLFSEEERDNQSKQMAAGGEVGRWLWFDAAAQAQLQRAEPAFRSIRAIVTMGRSADETQALALLMRAEANVRACAALQRVLGQLREPTDKDLASLQQLLDQEAGQPLLAKYLRTARAQHLEFWTQLAGANSAARAYVRRDPDPMVTLLAAESSFGGLECWMRAGQLKLRGVDDVQRLSRLLEWTSLPVEEQVVKFKDRQTATGFWTAAEMYHEDVAQLRCAGAGLAAERYRLAQQKWPTAWADLVPTYLPAPPVDPFTGQPLQLKPVEDGIAISSVGTEGKAIAFRLWNVAQRALPAAGEQ